MNPSESLEQAVRERLSGAGTATWGADAADAWLLEAIARRLAAHGATVEHLATPRKGLLDAVRRSLRASAANDDDLLRDMCVTLLAKGMRRRHRHFVHASHALTLSRLTSDEAHILLAFAERALAPIVLQLELRYESLRNGLPVRHRELLLDNALAAQAPIKRPAMLGAYVANLERLRLLVVGSMDVMPAEDPEHVRARAARGSLPVPMGIQFRRWLTGRDVNASSSVTDRGATRRVTGGVGGIQIVAKTARLSADGRALLYAVTNRDMVARSRPRPATPPR